MLQALNRAATSSGIATDGSLSPKDGDQCKMCDMVIPRGSGSVTAHLLSETHRAHAREMGVYCSCGKSFLNPASFPYHTCAPPSAIPPGTAPHGFDSCQICGISALPQGGLRQHKESRRHLDRAKEFGYKCVCVRFFSDLGTMMRHKCFDKAMLGHQTNSTGGGTRVPPLLRLDCTGCRMFFHSEKEFFAYHKGHKGVHSPVWISPLELTSKPLSTCQLCDVNLYQPGSWEAHKKMQSHIDLCISKGLYCFPCKKSFESDTAAQGHQIRFHEPNRPTEFRCCDCRQSFPTNKLLGKHACPWVPPEGYHACEPCNLRFSSKRALVLHLSSKNHKPIKCLGGGGCIRTFKDLPGMLQHLESGACKSKMNKKTIDALLKKHDTSNTITIEGAGEPATPAALPSRPSTSHISSASAVIEEVDTDSDDEDSGGVIFTPTSTPPRRGSIDNDAPTPIDPPALTSIDSYSFPRTLAPLGFGISELGSWPSGHRFCPICSKTFKRPDGLASHIASPAHAARIYHCPKGFLAEMGMEMDRHGVERTFKTLSGLAQHIHARACTSDKDAWVKVVRFLEEKLSGLGCDGVRLLSQ